MHVNSLNLRSRESIAYLENIVSNSESDQSCLLLPDSLSTLLIYQNMIHDINMINLVVLSQERGEITSIMTKTKKNRAYL